MARLRRALARMRDSLASHGDRGLSFWLVTALLGLLLPAPVAVVVVAARLRRAGAPTPARSRSVLDGSRVLSP